MKIKSFVRPMYLATGCFPSSLERPTSSVVEVTWADPKALSMMSLTCVCLGYVPFAFYRLTPVSKPVNKRLVMLLRLLLGQETHKTHNTSKAPKTSCTPSTYKST